MSIGAPEAARMSFEKPPHTSHKALSNWLIERLSERGSLTASSIQTVPAASYCDVSETLSIILSYCITSRKPASIAPEAALVMATGSMSRTVDGDIEGHLHLMTVQDFEEGFIHKSLGAFGPLGHELVVPILCSTLRQLPQKKAVMATGDVSSETAGPGTAT